MDALQKIFDAREKQGTSLSHLSRITGLSRGHLSRIFNGRSEPGEKVMMALKKFYNIKEEVK